MRTIIIFVLGIIYFSVALGQNEDGSAILKEAQESYKNKDLEGAYTKYKQYISEYAEQVKENPSIYYVFGVVCYKSGKIDEAVNSFLLSASNDYKIAPSYKNAITLLKKDGQTDKAWELTTEAVEKYPLERALIQLAAKEYMYKGNDIFNEAVTVKNDAGNEVALKKMTMESDEYLNIIAHADSLLIVAESLINQSIEFNPNDNNAQQIKEAIQEMKQ